MWNLGIDVSYNIVSSPVLAKRHEGVRKIQSYVNYTVIINTLSLYYVHSIMISYTKFKNENIKLDKIFLHFQF